ncbi:MAG: hypothetical protein GY869_26335 [Planctomycetes bacterium]|nr:hypothetical protein [Planctomycetota bacterium]
MIKSPIILIVILLLFGVISCTGPQPTSPDSASNNFESDETFIQSQILSRLTDDVLVALATNNYSRLEKLIRPDQRHLSGAQAAVLLVGSHATTMAIGPWDAQQIIVTFDNQMLNATTKVDVTYRLSLNREPQTSLFTFNFTRTGPTDSWLMVIR